MTLPLESFRLVQRIKVYIIDFFETIYYRILVAFGPPGPCLVSRKFYKIFHIPHHIESLDACMKY